MPLRLGLVVLVILGCAGVGPGADEETGEAEPAVPTSGEYMFESVDTRGDCADDGDPTDENTEPVEIVVADDGESFTFGEAECALDGAAFDCVLADEETDYGASGMDALVGVRAELVGRWTSDTRIELTSRTEVSCEGSDCDDLEEMGVEFCSSESDMVGTRED